MMPNEGLSGLVARVPVSTGTAGTTETPTGTAIEPEPDSRCESVSGGRAP
jgi:hypothetical protein